VLPDIPENADLNMAPSPIAAARRHKQEKFHKHKGSPSSSPSPSPSSSPGLRGRRAHGNHHHHDPALDNFSLEIGAYEGNFDAAEWREDWPGENSVVFARDESPRDLGNRIRAALQHTSDVNMTGPSQTTNAPIQQKKKKKKNKKKKKADNTGVTQLQNDGKQRPPSLRVGGLLSEPQMERTAQLREARIEKQVGIAFFICACAVSAQ